MNSKETTTRSVSESLDRRKEQDRVKEETPSLEDLILALSSLNDAERVKARHALVALGKPAIPPLVGSLKSKNDIIRWEVVKALGEIGDAETAPVLVNILEDEEFSIRWLAATGLIGMNVRALKPLLQALMEQGNSHLMREGAHHVIHDLAKGELRKYLAPVLVALEDVAPAVAVPGAALHALEVLEKDHKL